MTNMMKEKKPKRGFMDGYKIYNPEVEGFGNPSDWKFNFRKKMKLDEAVQILGDNDPLELLGLIVGFTLDQLKKAYRKKAMEAHPDRNIGNEAEAEKNFKKIHAAYTKLSAMFK